MNRQQKEHIVGLLKESFQQSSGAFAAIYQGLGVVKMQELRIQLREKGGALHVAKARLMRLALSHGVANDAFIDTLRGQICLVFAQNELPEIAKILCDFAKKNDALKVISGSYDEVVFDSAQVSQLAKLPSREVLLAQVAGALNAPVAGFIRLLHTLIARLVWLLKQIEDQKRVSA
jgi:large subunit ribosomal protein L10